MNLQDILKDRQEIRNYIGPGLDRLIITLYKANSPAKEKTILWPMIAEYFTA